MQGLRTILMFLFNTNFNPIIELTNVTKKIFLIVPKAPISVQTVYFFEVQGQKKKYREEFTSVNNFLHFFNNAKISQKRNFYL